MDLSSVDCGSPIAERRRLRGPRCPNERYLCRRRVGGGQHEPPRLRRRLPRRRPGWIEGDGYLAHPMADRPVHFVRSKSPVGSFTANEPLESAGQTSETPATCQSRIHGLAIALEGTNTGSGRPAAPHSCFSDRPPYCRPRGRSLPTELRVGAYRQGRKSPSVHSLASTRRSSSGREHSERRPPHRATLSRHHLVRRPE